MRYTLYVPYKNREDKNAQGRRWRAANLEACREYARKKSREYYAAHRERILENMRARRLSNPEQWERELASKRASRRRLNGCVDAPDDAKKGACPICGVDGELVCDHVHLDGKVGPMRGWICRRCNSGIGLLGDDPIRLKRALIYLMAPLG